MAGSIKLNTREFNAALREYLKVNKRELSEIINFKMKAIVFDAMALTKTPQGKSIRRELMQEVGRRNVRSRKTGRRVKGRKIPLAELIIRKRGWDFKKKQLTETAMKEAIRAMVNARVKAAGFIKSGWLPAVKALVNAVKIGPRRPKAGNAKQRGKPKGFGRPARSTNWRPSVLVENSAILPFSKSSAKTGNPFPVALKALQKAFDNETRSMIAYMHSKLQPIANKFSGKKP